MKPSAATGVRLREGAPGGRVVAVGRLGDERADVGVVHAGAPLACGFALPVDRRRAPAGRYALEACAGSDDAASWHPFAEVELPIVEPDAPSLLPALHGVAHGRPEAFLALDAVAQDFLAETLRIRGRAMPGDWAQYAPHPIEAEVFPRADDALTQAAAPELPRVVVVVPSYNQGAYLGATMASILDQQPGVRVACAVMDGGSSDESVAVIRRHAARLAHWQTGPDGGQAAAVNAGFAAIPAEADDVMAFLNADDLYLPGALRYVAEHFVRHPECDFVYGHRVIVDADGHETGRWWTPRPACADLRQHDFVPQETLFWRRRAWERAGPLNAARHYALDWDFLVSLQEAGAVGHRLPWFLAAYRRHAEQKGVRLLPTAGVSESSDVRRRALGREADESELLATFRLAQVEAALLHGAFLRGQRL